MAPRQPARGPGPFAWSPTPCASSVWDYTVEARYAAGDASRLSALAALRRITAMTNPQNLSLRPMLDALRQQAAALGIFPSIPSRSQPRPISTRPSPR
jgi:hypothetical protein